MVLEAVYEQDFLPCSFGFRPGRSAHQALRSLHTAIMSQGLRWVVDIDIVKFVRSPALVRFALLAHQLGLRNGFQNCVGICEQRREDQVSR